MNSTFFWIENNTTLKKKTIVTSGKFFKILFVIVLHALVTIMEGLKAIPNF